MIVLYHNRIKTANFIHDDCRSATNAEAVFQRYKGCPRSWRVDGSFGPETVLFVYQRRAMYNDVTVAEAHIMDWTEGEPHA